MTDCLNKNITVNQPTYCEDGDPSTVMYDWMHVRAVGPNCLKDTRLCGTTFVDHLDSCLPAISYNDIPADPIVLNPPPTNVVAWSQKFFTLVEIPSGTNVPGAWLFGGEFRCNVENMQQLSTAPIMPPPYVYSLNFTFNPLINRYYQANPFTLTGVVQVSEPSAFASGAGNPFISMAGCTNSISFSPVTGLFTVTVQVAYVPNTTLDLVGLQVNFRGSLNYNCAIAPPPPPPI